MALSDADVTGRKLVIFDFDGTLANTVPSIVSTARTVLARHGLTEESMGDLKRLVGPPFPQAYEWVYGFSPEEAAQITTEYRALYNTIGASAWPLFPGVREMLSSVRDAGRLTAVASSKQMRLISRALDDNDIPYMSLCFTGLKDSVQATVHIDDSPANIESLRAVGQHVVIFDQPYNRHLPGPRAGTARGHGFAGGI